MQSVKELRRTLMLVALTTVPMTAAHAAADLDLYYTPYTTLKFEDANAQDLKFDDGDGWGVKGKFGLVHNLFLSGEFEKNSYDDIRINGEPILPGFPGTSLDLSQKTEQYRAGLGYVFNDTPFYALGEYIRYDSKLRVSDGNSAQYSDDDTQEGWGAHLGLKHKVLKNALTLNAEIGYVAIGDVDGLEVLGGVAMNITEHLGLFADYRLTSLVGNDSTPDTRLEEVRVGARISF